MQHKFWLIVVICLSLLIPANQYASAHSYSSPIASKYLNGIDTVVVQIYGGPVYKLLDSQFKHSELYPRKVVFETIKEVFSSESWLKVIQYSELIEQSELLKPNMLGIYVALSAQQEVIDGKPITVAAVSVSFKHFLANGTPEEISTLVPVTFPFIVENDQRLFSEKLKKGVKFLTHYIPSNLCFANRPRSTCKGKESDYNPWDQ